MEIPLDIECAIRTGKNVLISGGDAATRTALARLIHERSARRQAGRTLFIEELAALDEPAQDALMRLLDRGVDLHAGDAPETRIISATADHLIERLDSRLFDTGLFYRLNVIHIALGDVRRQTTPATVH